MVRCLAAGLAGAVALTVTHQVLHNFIDDAPRMDLMGEEALIKIAEKTGTMIPEDNLFNITLAGDVAGNALYYAMAGLGDRKNATLRGTLLGLAAGIGGVVLPKHIGLTNSYSNRTNTTKLLTVAIYTLGGFIAGKILQRGENS